jgi:cell division septum initiation protein DivIVA
VSASEVSAFEPQPPAESMVDMPEFVVVRRGVDRRQVEEWGKKLTSLIERERRRAEQAERALYRTQLEAKGTPSFTHLGAHAAGIIEEAAQSAEKLLLDAEARAQDAVGRAEAEAAGIVEEAEGRAGKIEGAALKDAERLRAEGARAAEEVRKAAQGFRAQTEQKARSLLEDAREAAEALWQEAERKRVAVEGETRRLEALRERTHEQLARMYGHLESVLGEVRRGIGGAEDAGEEPGPASAGG